MFCGLQIITGGLQFGAGVGLTELKDTLEGQSEQEAYAAIATTLRAVANTNVRNVATWAGNLMLHKLHGDALTLLPLVLVVMMKSKELETKISHAHSLILTLLPADVHTQR